MMLTLLLLAQALVLGIAAVEGLLLVALLRQLPRWHWQLLCLHVHARYAYVLFRVRRWWSRMQCHMHPASPTLAREMTEQRSWSWTELEDAIHAALAIDITLLCQNGQEVVV